MNDNLCFNRTQFIVLLTIITVILFGYYLKRTEKPEVEIQKAEPTKYSRQDPHFIRPEILSNRPVSISPPQPIIPPPGDPISRTDLMKMDDPLYGPYRRQPRDQLPPYYLDQVYTRGLPDNYTMLGTLTRIDEGSDSDRILPLFGRQTYPGSSQWEYYTTTTNLGVQLKIPFETRKQELFTDDIIKLQQFKSAEYKVSLYKLDSPVYNPFVLY